MEERVTRLVMEYALNAPSVPIDPGLSLRKDLAIDSLSLVSLTLRLGDEMEFDVVERGVELGKLETFRDLVDLGRSMEPGARVNANQE